MYFRNLPIITAGVFFFFQGKSFTHARHLGSVAAWQCETLRFLLSTHQNPSHHTVSGVRNHLGIYHRTLPAVSIITSIASIVCPISHFVYVVCCLFHMSISLHIIIDLIILYIICIDSVINGIKVSGVLFCLVTTYVDFSPSIAVKSSVFCGIG